MKALQQLYNYGGIPTPLGAIILNLEACGCTGRAQGLYILALIRRGPLDS